MKSIFTRLGRSRKGAFDEAVDVIIPFMVIVFMFFFMYMYVGQHKSIVENKIYEKQERVAGHESLALFLRSPVADYIPQESWKDFPPGVMEMSWSEFISWMDEGDAVVSKHMYMIEYGYRIFFNEVFGQGGEQGSRTWALYFVSVDKETGQSRELKENFNYNIDQAGFIQYIPSRVDGRFIEVRLWVGEEGMDKALGR